MFIRLLRCRIDFVYFVWRNLKLWEMTEIAEGERKVSLDEVVCLKKGADLLVDYIILYTLKYS